MLITSHLVRQMVEYYSIWNIEKREAQIEQRGFSVGTSFQNREETCLELARQRRPWEAYQRIARCKNPDVEMLVQISTVLGNNVDTGG